MLSTYLALQAAILFAASGSKLITDAQFVGTWMPTHAVGTITYHADHTCTARDYIEDGANLIRGTWRLQGRELITRFNDDLGDREFVLSVTAVQFKTRLSNGHVVTYRRVKPKRTSASNHAMERTADRCARHF